MKLYCSDGSMASHRPDEYVSTGRDSQCLPAARFVPSMKTSAAASSPPGGGKKKTLRWHLDSAISKKTTSALLYFCPSAPQEWHVSAVYFPHWYRGERRAGSFLETPRKKWKVSPVMWQVSGEIRETSWNHCHCLEVFPPRWLLPLPTRLRIHDVKRRDTSIIVDTEHTQLRCFCVSRCF